MDIRYKFTFPTGRVEEINLQFDNYSFLMKPSSVEVTPSPWMKLGFHQCPDCTLEVTPSALCPVAANLGGVVSHFKDDDSQIPVATVATFRGRQIGKKCELQSGLSSLFGLVMASSNCPLLDWLRPMVYTHQPFATMEETFFRVVSVYLIGQHMREKQRLEVNTSLSGLKKIYRSIDHVNKAFSHRIQGMTQEDAGTNALMLLDVFSRMGAVSLDDSWGDQLEPLFSRYLQET